MNTRLPRTSGSQSPLPRNWHSAEIFHCAVLISRRNSGDFQLLNQKLVLSQLLGNWQDCHRPVQLSKFIDYWWLATYKEWLQRSTASNTSYDTLKAKPFPMIDTKYALSIILQPFIIVACG